MAFILQEYITPALIYWVENEVHSKIRTKSAKGNVPASKTHAHFGCQRLTHNILPVAAAASRETWCQSVRRHNVFLMMSVTGEIGNFIS